MLLRLQVRALSNSFAEKDGAPLSWRTDQRYSGLNIGVLGIFYEPLQRRVPLPVLTCTYCVCVLYSIKSAGLCSMTSLGPLITTCGQLTFEPQSPL